MNSETNGPKPRRLQILGEEEIAAIYDRPLFTYDERAHYFSLSALEKAALHQFHTFPPRASSANSGKLHFKTEHEQQIWRQRCKN